MSGVGRTTFHVVLISCASLVQIVVQFLFQRVLAAEFGADAEIDALAAAFALPIWFAAFITGSLSYVLVPELVRAFRDDASHRRAWRLASLVGSLTLLISLAASGLLILASDSLCRWLYSDLDADQLTQTSQLLQILAIQVLLNGLISWGQAVQHSRHRFVLPAVAGVVGTSLTLFLAYTRLGLASVGALVGEGQSEILQIAWAINAGSLASGLLHVVPLLGRLRWPTTEWMQFAKLARLFWPLLVGTACLRLDPVVDRILAAKLAVEESGPIAYINFSQRVVAALVAIGTSGLAIVAFPRLAGRVEGEDSTEFASQFALAFRRLVLIVVPIAMGVEIFSVRIIGDLLQLGAFTANDSRMVGGLVAAFMGLFIGATFGDLLARAFYAVGDTRTPTWIGLLSLLLGLVVKVALFAWIGIWGIALGVSCYYLIGSTVMAVWLAKRFGRAMFADCREFFWQAGLVTCIACGVCEAVYRLPGGNTWLAAPVAAATYGVGLLWIGNRDALLVVRQLRETLAGWWSNSSSKGGNDGG